MNDLEAALEIIDERDRGEPFRCDVEWDGTLLCKPHQCERGIGHFGPHICSCGMHRRVSNHDSAFRLRKFVNPSASSGE